LNRNTPISLSTILIGSLITLLTGCSALNHDRSKTSDSNLQGRSDNNRPSSCDQYSASYNSNTAGDDGYSNGSGISENTNYQHDASSALRSDAPDRYVVKKGDTLWDISATFLSQPWYWPEIWHVNPEVANPHLIYPGDILSLYYVDGQPRIGINRGDYKLSPTIRSISLANNEPVSIAGLRPFMIRPSVISEEELRDAAHVVGSQDDRMIFGIGDNIYVHQLANSSPGSKYSIFRPSKKLYSVRGKKEFLGYEAIYASDATVIEDGEPSTVRVESSKREVLIGDRVLPLNMNPADLQFFPHAPPPNIDGNVVSIFDALSGIATYQIAVVDVGARDCIEPGHVLAINKSGRNQNDKFHRRMRPDTGLFQNTSTRKIQLPDEQSGVMLVFRSFEKVSYGVMMQSTRPIRVGDTATAPE